MSGTAIMSGYRARQENEVLRSAFIQSEVERRRGISSYHQVRLGIRDGGSISWIGSWSQASNKLDAGEPLPLLAPARKGMRLTKGHQLVAEVTAVGSPDSISDTVIDCEIERVGGISGRERLVVQTGTDRLDAATREAVETIQNQIKSSGIGAFVYPIYLRDPQVSPDERLKIADEETTSSKSVSTGSYVDGDLTIDVQLPAGATRARGIIMAQASFDSSSASVVSSLDVAISDGTTDYADALGGSTGDGNHDNVVAIYPFDVAQSTTFKNRLQSYTNTVTVTRQRLVAFWGVV